MANLGYQTNRQAIVDERDKKKGGGKFYKFKTGKTVIRVMPPYSERGVWFREAQEYWFEIDGEAVNLTSPRSNGGEDPIRAFGANLYKSEDTAKMELAKELRPRTTYLVNAVIISDPEKGNALLGEGVQVISLPVRVKETLVDLDTDEDAGFADITNIQNGFNIVIEKTGKGLDTRYTVKAMRERSNILDLARNHGVNTEKWNVNNLDECVKPDSVERLREVLAKYLESSPKAQALGLSARPAPAVASAPAAQAYVPAQNTAQFAVTADGIVPVPAGQFAGAPAPVVPPAPPMAPPAPPTINPIAVPDVPPPPIEG